MYKLLALTLVGTLVPTLGAHAIPTHLQNMTGTTITRLYVRPTGAEGWHLLLGYHDTGLTAPSGITLTGNNFEWRSRATMMPDIPAEFCHNVQFQIETPEGTYVTDNQKGVCIKGTNIEPYPIRLP